MKKYLVNVASFALATFFTFFSLSAQGLKTRLIEGRVTAGGEGLASVAVTDGTNIVKTDANGFYSILTLADSRFVYITVPSGYDVDCKDSTIPQFYKEISSADNFDFSLTKSNIDVKRHVFFVHTDAQVTSL